MEKIKTNLSNVPETMLISLRARRNETLLENGIIKDPKSIEIIDEIESNVAKKGEVSIASQKGVSVRTEILDKMPFFMRMSFYLFPFFRKSMKIVHLKSK